MSQLSLDLKHWTDESCSLRSISNSSATASRFNELADQCTITYLTQQQKGMYIPEKKSYVTEYIRNTKENPYINKGGETKE